MERILITGIGLVSTFLADYLTNSGYTVIFLSRTIPKNFKFKVYTWDIKQQTIDSEALKNTDYLINLAGANLSEKRWTKTRINELYDSRINSTNLLFKTVTENKISLKGYIGASAVGYYGSITSDKVFTEADSHYSDFVGLLCYSWEKSHLQFQSLYIPTSIIRIGVVLSNQGGALQKMTRVFNNNMGSVLGNGNQFMPWIHIRDLCLIITSIIKSNKFEIYNAVSNEHITNRILTQKLANKLNKNILLPPTPSFVLKLILGKMASIINEGSRVSNEKVRIELAIKLEFENLNKALTDLFKKEN